MGKSVSLYDIERTSTPDTLKFNVRPLSVFGAFRTYTTYIVYALISLIFLAVNPYLGAFITLVLVLILLWMFKWAGYNKCRRPMTFEAGPAGVTIYGDNPQTLRLEDIERIYITAPKAGQVSVTTGFAEGKMFTGVSTTGTTSAGVASRSWQVVVQARGHEHWLAGGLSEAMASSLQMKVRDALPIAWK